MIFSLQEGKKIHQFSPLVSDFHNFLSPRRGKYPLIPSPPISFLKFVSHQKVMRWLLQFPLSSHVFSQISLEEEGKKNSFYSPFFWCRFSILSPRSKQFSLLETSKNKTTPLILHVLIFSQFFLYKKEKNQLLQFSMSSSIFPNLFLSKKEKKMSINSPLLSSCIFSQFSLPKKKKKNSFISQCLFSNFLLSKKDENTVSFNSPILQYLFPIFYLHEGKELLPLIRV